MNSVTPDATRRRAIVQILLLAAGFLVLVAISVASVLLVNKARKDNALVVHTVEVENQIDALLLEIRRAESAARGYLLTLRPGIPQRSRERPGEHHSRRRQARAIDPRQSRAGRERQEAATGDRNAVGPVRLANELRQSEPTCRRRRVGSGGRCRQYQRHHPRDRKRHARGGRRGCSRSARKMPTAARSSPPASPSPAPAS